MILFSKVFAHTAPKKNFLVRTNQNYLLKTIFFVMLFPPELRL